MPSPHVTRAVDSTTAAGTAQPLTCGRPRQTGRRSAMSGIRGCQQGSSEQVRRPKPTAEISGGERCCGSAGIREVGADHRCGTGWRMAHSCSPVYATHQDGGVAGVSPAEGGVPAISAPARGKAFPHQHAPRRILACEGDASTALRVRFSWRAETNGTFSNIGARIINSRAPSGFATE